jgi:large subunit ribosomal protein L10e
VAQGKKMAKLRKFAAYRKLERPYTRISKFRKKSFIRASPHCNVVRFDMGASNKKFQYTINLISRNDLQIRHNAIESARQSSNKILEETLGKSGYFMKVKIYPHHVLRENPLAAGAGADRMSTGMKMSFGKPIGIAAQVKKGQAIVELRVDKQNLNIARKSLKRFINKIPCSCGIEVVENKAN